MQLQVWSPELDPGIPAPEPVLFTSIYTIASNNATNTGDQ